MTPAPPPQDEIDDDEVALPPLGGSAEKDGEGVIHHHPFGLLYPQSRD